MNRTSALTILFLGLLTVALGYAVLTLGTPIAQSGSEGRQHRQIYLLALGLLGLFYWISTVRQHPTPRLEPVLRWATVLLPCYAAFQLLPLPLSLVRIVSPSRAELVDGLARIGLTPAYVPLSVAPSATLTLFLLFLGYAVVFLLVRDMALRNPGHRWLPAVPIILIGSLEAALGLAQSFGGRTGSPAVGTYAIRNHFAGLLEMVFPFPVMYAIARLRHVDAPHRSPLLHALGAALGFALSALILLGILYSLSRMGFIAALASLLVIGVVASSSQWTVWKRSAAAAVCLLLPLVFAFLAPPALVVRFTQSAGRMEIWHDTRRLIAAYPFFGCGLGGYASAFRKFKVSTPAFTPEYAHNDYLQLLAELGIIGFSIAAALLVSILMRSVRAARREPLPDARFVGLACTGAIAAILIHSAADFNLYVPANAAVLAWILGIAAALPTGRGDWRVTDLDAQQKRRRS